MKRTAIRPRSRRRAAEYVQRRKLVEEMLEEFPWCFRCYWERATDLHELKRRSQGGDILDRSQIVTLCRGCHDWCGLEPQKAHDEGWVFWSHETVSAPRSYEDTFCPEHRLWAPVRGCCDEQWAADLTGPS